MHPRIPRLRGGPRSLLLALWMTLVLTLAAGRVPAAATSLDSELDSDSEPEISKTWTQYASDARKELRQNRYRSAESLYLKSLTAAAKHDPGGHRVDTALANLRHLLDVYREKDLAEDFARLAESYIEAYRLARGEPPVELQVELGKYYIQEYELEEGERHLSEALITLEAAKDPDVDAIVGLLADLGALRVKQQRFDDAEAQYSRAFEVAEMSDPGSRSTALAMNSLAWFYVERERFDEAIPLAERSMSILDALDLPARNKIGIVDTLAWAYAQSGQWNEALDLYRGALGDYSQGTRSPRLKLELLEVYDRYKQVLRATGNGDQALQLERRMLRAESLLAMKQERAKEARTKTRRTGVMASSRRADDEEILDDYEPGGFGDPTDATALDSTEGPSFEESTADDYSSEARGFGTDDSGYGPNEQVRRLPEPDAPSQITPLNVEAPDFVREKLGGRETETPPAVWDEY